ncbi:MAG: Rnase Y domain-containing protein [Chitinophagales bacterium]|nr:Rnase Y domain-containing protein [Chitinophagales bacterium]
MIAVIVAVVTALVSLGIGFLGGKSLASSKAKEIDDAAKKEADILVKKAKAEAETYLEKAEAKSESIKQSKILETKENFLQKKAQFEEETNEKREKLREKENQLRETQKQISQKFEENARKEKDLDSLKSNLTDQLNLMNIKREQVEKQHE